MVYMHSLKRKRKLITTLRQQGVQQNHRIKSTREPQHQPRMRWDVAGQTVRHVCGNTLTWQGFP